MHEGRENAGDECGIGQPDALGGDPRADVPADHPRDVSLGGEGQSDSFNGRYAGGRARGVGVGNFFYPNINTVHLTSGVTFC